MGPIMKKTVTLRYQMTSGNLGNTYSFIVNIQYLDKNTYGQIELNFSNVVSVAAGSLSITTNGTC
jgi:hypothetical protein